jgi:GNAT superfamily N-acetyltransferase
MTTPVTSTDLPANVTIRHDLKPGDTGYVIYLHGILYAMEHGWDCTFEAYVAGPLAKFVRSHTDRSRMWIVERDGEIAGSVAVVEVSRERAQLRWLLLRPDLRRQGIGRLLVQEAISFCRASGYSSIFLWTVSTLTPATNLYESVGFGLTEEKTHRAWGALITEQRYDLKLR